VGNQCTGAANLIEATAGKQHFQLFAPKKASEVSDVPDKPTPLAYNHFPDQNTFVEQFSLSTDYHVSGGLMPTARFELLASVFIVH
jgi:hypothetical protein